MAMLARWGDRARRLAWSSMGLLGLVSGCEVVGEIGGADDLVTTGSTSGPASANSGSTTDANDAATSSTSSGTDAPDPDTLAFDLGSRGSETGEDATSSGTSNGTDTFDGTTSGASSGGGPPDDASSETVGGGMVSCCEPGEEPGCADPEVEACVCEADAFCCENQWDAACVDVAIYGACGGACDVPEVPPPDDCCAVNDAAGCVDMGVQDCVCGYDPYCCDYAWDEVCVDYVDEYGCGACGG